LLFVHHFASPAKQNSNPFQRKSHERNHANERQEPGTGHRSRALGGAIVSTNGIIARSTGEGTFAGVYHHWDSYPNEGLGHFLIHILTGHFDNDLARMLHFLIDEHPAGWSTIVNKDFALNVPV
jgi:hypothetical protein